MKLLVTIKRKERIIPVADHRPVARLLVSEVSERP
jgi:hypothetical protein